MYQALYRKYRPRSFEDVVGQEHITKTLRRQVETGRLSHAYLFVGTRGTGKTTCARILAKACNCEHPIHGNPCNCCPSCLGIDSGSILDVEELDAASNNSVDNIRALRDEAVFTPAAVRKRVYIVDEVHMLSTSAFNALLKILEEPPEHILFILATTEIHKVLPTILSRCQRFTFRRLTPMEIAGRLADIAVRERLSLTPDAADLLSRMADGSMRDGISLLDQCAWEGPIDTERVTDAVGLAGTANTEALLSLIARGDTGEALTLLDRLYAAGKGLDAVLEELLSLMRDALVTQVTASAGVGLVSGIHSAQVVADFARVLPPERLLCCVRVAQNALTELGRAADKRTEAELCLIRLCRPELATDSDGLSARIAALETRLASGAPMPVREADSAAATTPTPAAVSAPIAPPAATPATATPVRSPAPAATPTPAAPAARVPAPETVWPEIAERLRAAVQVPDSIFLTDPGFMDAAYAGGVLTLRPKSPLGEVVLGKPEILPAVKAAAEAVCGAPVTVKAGGEPAAPATPQTDKLDALGQFGNVILK